MDGDARAPADRDPPVSRGWALWIVAACVPAALAIAYVIVESTGGRDAPQGPAPRAAPTGPGTPPTVMVERLSAKLRTNPEDGEGWAALGRALAALGRFPEAADAFGEAAKRLPASAALLADRADVLAMAQGRRFSGEPDRLIQAALEADPRHAKALALAGSSAFDRGDYAVAADHWRRLLALVPPQGQTAREVQARILEAEKRAEEGRPASPGTRVR